MIGRTSCLANEGGVIFASATAIPFVGYVGAEFLATDAPAAGTFVFFYKRCLYIGANRPMTLDSREGLFRLYHSALHRMEAILKRLERGVLTPEFLAFRVTNRFLYLFPSPDHMPSGRCVFVSLLLCFGVH